MKELKITALALAIFAGSTAFAQTPPMSMPPEVLALPAPSADAIKQTISGKTTNAYLANGKTWRFQFESNGYFYVNFAAGSYGNASGSWRVEDGKLCVTVTSTGQKEECNDARVLADGSLMISSPVQRHIRFAVAN